LPASHISRHHLAGDDVVGQHGSQLGLVLEQGFQVGLGHFGECFVSRCENREGALALERIDQTGCAQRGSQGLEVARAYGGVNDVLACAETATPSASTEAINSFFIGISKRLNSMFNVREY